MTINRTSQAVTDLLLTETTSRKKVAIAEKYKRMEIGLLEAKSALDHPPGCDCRICAAITFDPLK